jgi:hypothetical protein
MVIAIGGGSAIDTGKALAALLTNPGEPLDYLEVIGRGQPLQHPSAPLIAVPTTAGSGAEVTRNAVLASPEHRVKASLRSPFLLPRLALVDPELTLNLPRAITAATGLDALTQLIEPYVSSRANAMTDLYCVDGLRRAAAALPRVWEDGQDREARTAMSWASLLGGMALANAGLGAVHAFAAPMGGMWPAPHGAICAAVLPHAIEVNVEALRRRAPTTPRCAGTTRSRACSRASRTPSPTTPCCGSPISAIVWKFRRCGLTASPRRYPRSGRKGCGDQQHEGQPDPAYGRRAMRDRSSRAVNLEAVFRRRDAEGAEQLIMKLQWRMNLRRRRCEHRLWSARWMEAGQEETRQIASADRHTNQLRSIQSE